LLADLPGKRLNETIPDFHNTPSRYRAFEQSLTQDSLNRAKDAQTEIDFALQSKELAGALIQLRDNGTLPERVTHNDCKLNNVLIDNDSDEALCVIDLDTLMPGLASYDFGDLMRTSTCPVPEDSKDLTNAKMDIKMFSALAHGFLEGAGGSLLPAEIETLGLGGRVITLECGLRFLADFLQGDKYFKTSRDAQNLDRCRVQFALVRSMQEQQAEMAGVIHQLK